MFEGTVLIRIRDAQGTIIGKSFTTADAGAPARGKYSTEVSFTAPATAQNGTVEVYEESARDGSERNLISVPVRLQSR